MISILWLRNNPLVLIIMQWLSKLSLLCIIFCTLSIPTQASDLNSKLTNAEYCSQYFHYYEQTFGIPRNLLKTISLVETGRWLEEVKEVVPWPWAVNNNGKSYYFDNKKEAMAKVRALMHSGETNIDVGCMQINLKHHKEAFSSLEHALDPKRNIEYAAKFLISRYKQESTWKKAVSAYHSYTKPLGEKYLARVIHTFKKHSKATPEYAVYTNKKPLNNTVVVNQASSAIKKDSKRLRSPIIVSVN